MEYEDTANRKSQLIALLLTIVVVGSAFAYAM